jgi:hypothetical protein
MRLGTDAENFFMVYSSFAERWPLAAGKAGRLHGFVRLFCQYLDDVSSEAFFDLSVSGYWL